MKYRDELEKAAAKKGAPAKRTRTCDASQKPEGNPARKRIVYPALPPRALDGPREFIQHLAGTVYPKAGFVPWWQIEYDSDPDVNLSAVQFDAHVTLSVDPIVMQAGNLKARTLLQFVMRYVNLLRKKGLIPERIKLNIIIREEIKHVLGTITVGGGKDE